MAFVSLCLADVAVSVATEPYSTFRCSEMATLPAATSPAAFAVPTSPAAFIPAAAFGTSHASSVCGSAVAVSVTAQVPSDDGYDATASAAYGRSFTAF